MGELQERFLVSRKDSGLNPIECPNSALCDFAVRIDRNYERIYHRDSEFVIVDCLSCGLPMIVWWKCEEPTDEAKERALHVAEQLLGYKATLRNERMNYSHPHEHVLRVI